MTAEGTRRRLDGARFRRILGSLSWMTATPSRSSRMHGPDLIRAEQREAVHR